MSENNANDDLAKVIEELEQKCADKPDSVMAHHHLGLVYRKAGRLQDALAELEKAIEIGRTESVEALLKQETKNDDDDEEEDEINEAGRDMLLRLPGINIHNARRIMRECDSIAELSEMSREQLRKLAGPVAGQKLFTFFRQTIAAT